MKYHFLRLLILVLLSDLFEIKPAAAQDLKPSSNPPSRTYKLGFSPWPWDATLEAINWTYAKAIEHGDVISHHIEEGVPWNEAQSGDPFPKAMQEEVDNRLRRNANGQVTLLSVNALNTGRDGLAPNRGKNLNEALQAPWSKYDFNKPEVKLAYANYTERMIKLFHPKWVVIGIESNVLARKGMDANSKWPAYVELICSTNRSLKNRGIKIPILVSIVTTAFFPEWSPEDNLKNQQKVLEELDPCVDGFAVSAHPFVSGLLADKFPSDYFSRFFSFSKKWVGISESSYPAQVWSREGLTWNGSETKQADFLKKMFIEAQKVKLQFVIWFTVRDFDQLWAGLLRRDSISLVWRDTGLYSETGAPRSGLHIWTNELKKTFDGR